MEIETHYTVPPEDDDIDKGFTIKGATPPRTDVSFISSQ